jgi:hypothetical protein
MPQADDSPQPQTSSTDLINVTKADDWSPSQMVIFTTHIFDKQFLQRVTLLKNDETFLFVKIHVPWSFAIFLSSRFLRSRGWLAQGRCQHG